MSDDSMAPTLPQNGKFLVVDDVAVNTRLAELNINRHFPRGWVTHAVCSAEEAVAAGMQSSFDVILMDELFGKGMRGSDAIRLLREHEATTGLPRAVIITCTASDELVAKAMSGMLPAGADAVWPKPSPSAVDGTMQRQVAALLQAARGAANLGQEQYLERYALTAPEYLAAHGVEDALQRHVKGVLNERPIDPIEALGRRLLDERLG